MRKIPTAFVRDFAGDPSRVLPEWHPDCLWVRDGEGVATRKLDGTCCLWMDGRLWKRREVPAQGQAPSGFILAETDRATGKDVGWVPVGEGPEDKWHRAALLVAPPMTELATYELVGPKVQGGVERDYERPTLVPHHRAEVFPDAPRDLDGLRAWLDGRDIEGLVWHHPDGRAAKLKLKDLGLRRGTPARG